MPIVSKEAVSNTLDASDSSSTCEFSFLSSLNDFPKTPSHQDLQYRCSFCHTFQPVFDFADQFRAIPSNLTYSFLLSPPKSLNHLQISLNCWSVHLFSSCAWPIFYAMSLLFSVELFPTAISLAWYQFFPSMLGIFPVVMEAKRWVRMIKHHFESPLFFTQHSQWPFA
jgi:hypothetical protein